MDPEDLTNNLCWLLARASHTLLTEIHAALDDLGLSPRAHEVLLAALHEEHTQAELARIVGLDKTTMVNTIDELEAGGLAKRKPSAEDRRVRMVVVTPAGRRKVAQANEVIGRVDDSVLKTLPARERQVFFQSLKRLVAERLHEPVPTTKMVRRQA